jgi:hypothetical protein
MEAKELRIGNYVKEMSNVTQVSCWDFEKARLNNNEYEMPWLQPIPLSEEWIAKDYKENVFWSNFSQDNEGYFLWVGGYKVYIKHVHQLQNLYFALTGEELEITKTK